MARRRHLSFSYVAMARCTMHMYSCMHRLTFPPCLVSRTGVGCDPNAGRKRRGANGYDGAGALRVGAVGDGAEAEMGWDG